MYTNRVENLIFYENLLVNDQENVLQNVLYESRCSNMYVSVLQYVRLGNSKSKIVRRTSSYEHTRLDCDNIFFSLNSGSYTALQQDYGL